MYNVHPCRPALHLVLEIVCPLLGSYAGTPAAQESPTQKLMKNVMGGSLKSHYSLHSYNLQKRLNWIQASNLKRNRNISCSWVNQGQQAYGLTHITNYLRVILWLVATVQTHSQIICTVIILEWRIIHLTIYQLRNQKTLELWTGLDKTTSYKHVVIQNKCCDLAFWTMTWNFSRYWKLCLAPIGQVWNELYRSACGDWGWCFICGYNAYVHCTNLYWDRLLFMSFQNNQ